MSSLIIQNLGSIFEGDAATLNIKRRTIGICRLEYEYPIPLDDAQEMLAELCDKPYIDKMRYHVIQGGYQWEIDVFHGENEGLIVAELELKSADETFPRPDWLGQEVTHDARYYNICLLTQPYKSW